MVTARINMRRPVSETLIAIAICLLLGGLVLLAFGQAAWFGFSTYDDPEWISRNPAVQKGLSGEGVRYAFGSTIAGHWAPLTSLSHMAAWHVFGSNAGAHHLVNVGLHAAGAALLFLALRSLTGALWQSAAVAAIFAVHPLRAESVMWITERKDVLSGVFFFLTLWAYSWWTRRGGGGRYLVVLTLAACGLLSKSMLVTLPFVLLLLDVWPLQRWQGKGAVAWRLAEKLPFFALGIGMAIIQYRAVEVLGNTLVPLTELGWSGRVANGVGSYAIYVGQLFWPASLAVFYPHLGSPPTWQLITSILALLSITAVVCWFGREHRYLWVGWLWFLGMLVPVSGLVQSADLARADRYTYLPQIGLLIMVVWGIAASIRVGPRRTWFLAGGAAAVLAVAVIATRAQAGTWKNEETLWSHALAHTKGNHRAHLSLGVVEGDKGNFLAAIAHFREAIRLYPEMWSAYHNLGHALLMTDDIRPALMAATTAVQMNPRETAMSFGRAFKARERLNAAAWCFEQAVAARPGDDDAELELALVLGRLGAVKQCEQAYRSVLKRNPDQRRALVELGMFFMQAGRVDEAIPLLEKALQQAPDDSQLRTALANARVTQASRQ